jgi:hypothetical protein
VMRSATVELAEWRLHWGHAPLANGLLYIARWDSVQRVDQLPVTARSAWF